MNFTRFVFLLLISGSCAAQDIKIVSTIEQPVTQSSSMSRPASQLNRITLLKVELSPQAKQTMMKRAERAHSTLISPASSQSFPTAVQLGMNKVPVLNQGNHGTCVTFANTAAINAILNQGDYISQLCQLQLGRYLENHAYSSSGWNGSWGPNVLYQMRTFGIVSKAQQMAQGCHGEKEYSLTGPDSQAEMTVSEFHALSEPLSQEKIGWSSLLDLYQSSFDQVDMNRTLSQVKASLAAGDRLTFGVLFLDFDLGTVGAVGTHQSKNDTWVLTPEIANDIHADTNFAGHEMVITGYNDAAVAIDDHGRKHYGLLTLRNSWGSNVGHSGDFYMSYDYFKTLTIEISRIRNISSSGVVEPTN